MPSDKPPRKIAKLLLSSIVMTVIGVDFLSTPIAFAQPGGDRGPAILVPTDVSGNQIIEQIEESTPSSTSTLKVRFEKFPEKFNCKKYLIESDTDTKCSDLEKGSIKLETGKILVAPTDGRLLVHTKLADIAVPKDGVALIRIEAAHLSIFNLAGREFVVKFDEKESASPDKSTNYNEGVGLDEGFGIISHGTTKDSVANGIMQYVGPLVSSSAVIAVAMRDCELAVIDPMRILQQDSILKSLTTKWLPVLTKVEDTVVRVGVWQQDNKRH
jgi:hypothetical protein